MGLIFHGDLPNSPAVLTRTETMSDLLDQAVAKVRRLSQDRQDEAAEILLAIAEEDPSRYQLSAKQRAEVRRRLAEPPDYATDAEVEETFNRLTR